MNGAAIIGGGVIGRLDEIAVGFIHQNHVCELDDPFLDALQLVAGGGRQKQQE